MIKLTRIKSHVQPELDDARIVYVNPARITFIEPRISAGSEAQTAIWFGGRDTILLVEESTKDIDDAVYIWSNPDAGNY